MPKSVTNLFETLSTNVHSPTGGSDSGAKPSNKVSSFGSGGGGSTWGTGSSYSSSRSSGRSVIRYSMQLVAGSCTCVSCLIKLLIYMHVYLLVLISTQRPGLASFTD